MQMLSFGKCSLCDKPGVGAINANANAGATAQPVWESRCDEHNPYWNPSRAALIEEEYRETRAERDRYRMALHRIADGVVPDRYEDRGQQFQDMAEEALADKRE